jgi:hypothetical protein
VGFAAVRYHFAQGVKMFEQKGQVYGRLPKHNTQKKRKLSVIVCS